MSEALTLRVPEQELFIRSKTTSWRHYVDNKKDYFLAKRILDLLISGLVILIILSWLLPVLALLIKCTSRGPVFFLQKRTGRGGKSFTCYKLRTMAYNPVTPFKRVSSIEQPITRLGRFLRESNLDELPQFFNVLAGTMSIVGPRPHMHSDCNAFSRLIPQYKFRNLVTPGITGMAQVKGYHGKILSPECIYKRYEWDAFYVKNAGLWLDLKIMVQTAFQRIGIIIKYSQKSEVRSLKSEDTAV